MRKIVLIATLFFASCNNNTKILLASSGNLNEISVVVEDQLWEGDVGKALKKTLSRPIYGLPQQESLFKLRQIPPTIFSGFVTKSRTIIIIEAKKPRQTKLLLNKYASPQTVIILRGMTRNEIISELKKYSSKIINTINTTMNTTSTNSAKCLKNKKGECFRGYISIEEKMAATNYSIMRGTKHNAITYRPKYSTT
jgi:hypothetical protein